MAWPCGSRNNAGEAGLCGIYNHQEGYRLGYAVEMRLSRVSVPDSALRSLDTPSQRHRSVLQVRRAMGWSLFDFNHRLGSKGPYELVQTKYLHLGSCQHTIPTQGTIRHWILRARDRSQTLLALSLAAAACISVIPAGRRPPNLSQKAWMELKFRGSELLALLDPVPAVLGGSSPCRLTDGSR